MPIHVFAGSLTRSLPQYGAANGKGITRLTLDDPSGQLSLSGVTQGIEDSTWLVTNPAGDRLYTTCEVSGTDQSAVTAYAIDPATGALTLLNRQPTLGGEVCHASLSHDGRYLLVANYNSATPPGWPDQSVCVLPIAADGALQAAVCNLRHEGRGPNAERQTTAHAHCIIPVPNTNFVYVADLGIDRLVAYALADNGQLTPAPERDFTVPPGLGPRHIVFSADGQRLFMVSELIATVISFAVSPANGALSVVQSLPIAPPDDSIVQPAGIVLSPDGRHLLVSLRVSNEILGLAIDPATGTLRQTGRWS
ncbi:MAG TPA: lactonase family protein, partial [Devosia sp.]|nr:lactonase family protein [Devosia sp.]